MDDLIDGYRRFRSGTWPAERARYEALSIEGQRPATLVIACSDSRVDPATVFDAAPGELFVVRNVAGLVPPYRPDAEYHGTSAALEFGVRVLKVSRIVVLGHAQCGGVRAMVLGAPDEARDFVEPWVGIGRPIAESLARSANAGVAEADLLDRAEVETIRLTMDNLLSFPWIAEAVSHGRLAVHGCRFDIHTGTLARLDGDRLVAVG